jgi:putative SOS response-associated peptidase YedK
MQSRQGSAEAYRRARIKCGVDSPAWLGETEDGNLKNLLVPYPADQMRMWEISPRVNSPKNDDPSLWEPCIQSQHRRKPMCLNSRASRHMSGKSFCPNIAPSQKVLTIRFNPEARERSLDALHWGLIPYWAKDPKIAYRTINARAETVDKAPLFRQACSSSVRLDPGSSQGWQPDGRSGFSHGKAEPSTFK